ncbi:hypothetical protein GGC03_14455 [Vibrio sp. THAF191c]|nr:hypothetical protein CKJ79_22780 [Vibrio coralliilyticus]QFT37618.1 hypothetical protein FIU99_14450 [Vibrio sp. THAF64]QGM35520.1 hypothetical protein GGC04_14455 [Vibrio sp. THAF191d]QGN71021.1 hypothetical protein GGC03_14455 [Vibrio sp. THAF191c]
MIIYLELILVVTPLFILLLFAKGWIASNTAKLITSLALLALSSELLYSCFAVLGLIDIDIQQSTLFIGTEMWNVVLGPALFLFYIYVLTELTIIKPKKQGSSH